MVSDSPDPQTLDGQELYVVVRKAVEDAILSAIASIILALVGLWAIWFGMMIGIESLGQNTIQVFAGVFLVLLGLFISGSALGFLPSLDKLR